ncbi:MAG: hypothetical protein E3J81_02280 [Dehalococcoidia bacterium]|nr:MAG: hypothetical protein E3J81_02280 [Dehalococcoidia bacterium]
MAVEMSGIITLTFELDKNAAALGTTDEALKPCQGAGSVAEYHAIQGGCIRGLDCEIESAQSDGDDVIFSVYVGASRNPNPFPRAVADSSAGAKHGETRFDKDKIAVSNGAAIVVKAKCTDAVNCKPAGVLAVVYLQLGKSEI